MKYVHIHNDVFIVSLVQQLCNVGYFGKMICVVISLKRRCFIIVLYIFVASLNKTEVVRHVSIPSANKARKESLLDNLSTNYKTQLDNQTNLQLAK